MAKVIMVQGTMSNVGKSLIVAGLCRIFRQDGWRVAPFKSQNMALNSYITEDGLEMGRAQAMQAEAAGVKPEVFMNPILLKPTNDIGSQVIVNGRVVGNMPAREYFDYKINLIPDIEQAFRRLEEQAEIIVIEGAGSPAEINLKDNDIVNMGLAELVDAPVLLVGDIDRGGVFAQLLGTLMLLTEAERARVKGLVINKFRGDASLLDPGIEMLEEMGKVPVVGVVPYMKVQLEDEDSLSERLTRTGGMRRYGARGCGGFEGIGPGTDAVGSGALPTAAVRIAVIRFPRISNFTDFDVFGAVNGAEVYYVTSLAKLGQPDLVILPGSKNTMGDLLWMRECGLETAVRRLEAEGIPIIGICGGFQMLGMRISDPTGVESGGMVRGMELLAVETQLQGEKTRRQVEGELPKWTGILSELSHRRFRGYEIHMGRTVSTGRARAMTDSSRFVPDRSRTAASYGQIEADTGNFLHSASGSEYEIIPAEGMLFAAEGNVYGTYVHGVFDEGDIAPTLVRILASRKGISIEKGSVDYAAFREQQYDLLADGLRRHLERDQIYRMLGNA